MISKCIKATRQWDAIGGTEGRIFSLSLWPTDFRQQCQDNSVEEKIVFLKTGAKRAGYTHTKI